MLYPPPPMIAQKVETEAVRFGVYLAHQLVAESDELGGVQRTLEHGLLNPLSAILAGSGYPPKASASSSFCGRHIVSHENQQVFSFSTPNQGRIDIEVAPQPASE